MYFGTLNSQIRDALRLGFLNIKRLQSGVTFLYPPKTSENLKQQWVNDSSC